MRHEGFFVEEALILLAWNSNLRVINLKMTNYVNPYQINGLGMHFGGYDDQNNRNIR